MLLPDGRDGGFTVVFIPAMPEKRGDALSALVGVTMKNGTWDASPAARDVSTMMEKGASDEGGTAAGAGTGTTSTPVPGMECDSSELAEEPADASKPLLLWRLVSGRGGRPGEK